MVEKRYKRRAPEKPLDRSKASKIRYLEHAEDALCKCEDQSWVSVTTSESLVLYVLFLDFVFIPTCLAVRELRGTFRPSSSDPVAQEPHSGARRIGSGPSSEPPSDMIGDDHI